MKINPKITSICNLCRGFLKKYNLQVLLSIIVLMQIALLTDVDDLRYYIDSVENSVYSIPDYKRELESIESNISIYCGG